MSKYYQCCRDKKLKTTTDSPEITEITCCDRRMRELTQTQYDHEAIQRAHVESAGPVPSGTDLMTDLKI